MKRIAMQTLLKKFTPAALGLVAWMALPSAASIDGAVVPGADLVTRVDLAALRQAPVCAMLKENQSAEKKVKEAAFWAILGQREEDVQSLIFSADLKTLNDAAKGPSRILLGVESRAPWNLKTLATAVEAFVQKQEQQQNPALVLGEIQIAGQPALKIAKPAAAPAVPAAGRGNHQLDVEEIYAALADDGKVLVLGTTEADVAAALAVASPAAGLATSLQPQPGVQVSGGLILTDEMKKKLQPQAPQNGQPDPNAAMNPFAGVQKNFSNLNNARWTLSADQELALKVSLGLGSKEEALKGSGSLSSLVDLFRGLLAMQQQPANPDPQALAIRSFLESVKVGAEEKDVTLSLAVSKELARTLQAEIQAQMADKVHALAPPMEEDQPASAPARKSGRRPAPPQPKEVEVEPAV